MVYSFTKELYPKTALLKAAYSFIDSAYVHLDADEKHWIVTIDMKDETDSSTISEGDFVNEMLVQSLRHDIYEQTKNIREMLYARSVASSLVINDIGNRKLLRLKRKLFMPHSRKRRSFPASWTG